MTTATTADTTTRADAAAILRAVADLIENRQDIPVPGGGISFYLYGEDAPAVIAAMAAALPCQWQAEIRRSGSTEWLSLTSGSYSMRTLQVSINVPAADACTPAGAKTVTVWRPAAPLAGFLGPDALGEAS